MISRDVVFVETELPGLGLGGTSGPAYKPLASNPDAGGVGGSAPDKPLSFNLGSSSDNDDSDDDTPGPGSLSSAPGSVSAAPDNRATDPGSSSVPWPSRSSTPDNESDANLTPRASPSPSPSPSPGLALRRSTHIKKPPVEFWKLPKDRTAPAPVPEAEDEVPESDDAMHIANKAALSDQEVVEYALTAGDEPRTVREALKRDDAPLWHEAANSKYTSLLHGVWDLVECPPNRKPIGSGWVFRIKYNANGSVERYKAQLVAKGYTSSSDNFMVCNMNKHLARAILLEPFTPRGMASSPSVSIPEIRDYGRR